jgi:hypothetical protein
MNFETVVFLGVFGLLSGMLGASSAEAAPYVHWMHTLRRLSQSPLLLAFRHPEFALEPGTMWIRMMLALIAGLLYLVCAPRARDRGPAPRR